MGAAELQINLLKTIMVAFAAMMVVNGAAALPMLGNPDQAPKKKAKKDCESDPHSLKGMIEKINIFGSDKRVVQERGGAGKMFAPIGLITTNQAVAIKDPKDPKGVKVINSKSQATAFLVSPCYAVTNFHAVFGLSKNPNKTEFSVTFDNVTADGKTHEHTNAKPIMWGAFDKSSNIDDDWTLLELDQCKGKQVGWMEMNAITGTLPLKNVMSAGFPGDKSNASLWVDPSCSIIEDAKSQGWANDCALRSGSSGSPIMRLNSQGIPEVIAFQAADIRGTDVVLPKYDSAHANLAVNTGSLGGGIDMILADREKFGQPNPATQSLVASSASL